MNLYLIANIITCVCALIGFIYGAVNFFKPRKAVYAQMITLSVGCMAFGKLYQAVRLLTGGSILDEFQLGILGVIGSFAFLFSANYGAMDSLADDRSKNYAKYRIIPLVAPLVSLAVYVVFIYLSDMSRLEKIIGAIVTLFVSLSSYFNLKHLIFPDVDFGVINSLKTYNFMALIYGLLCIAELIAMSRDSAPAALVIDVLMGIILIAIVPSVERGIRKWTT